MHCNLSFLRDQETQHIKFQISCPFTVPCCPVLDWRLNLPKGKQYLARYVRSEEYDKLMSKPWRRDIVEELERQF